MKRALDPALILGLLAAFAASPAVATPPGMGACCVEGLCYVDSEADCAADGGLYLGDGTNCGGVSCACEEDLADSQVFPGDGAESGPELSYTDNGDGTVTDNNTLYMWEVKTLAQADGCLGDGGDGLHALYGSCTWDQAAEAWLDALNAEGGTGYAGYSDWRLPNAKELHSIVDYGHFSPVIDPVFGPTVPHYYWSATAYANNVGYAQYVDFDNGYMSARYKSGIYMAVRAVRGGP
jgi:hypothetical protein